MKSNYQPPRLDLKELYRLEALLIPVTALMSSVLYVLIISMINDGISSYSFGEMMWFVGVGVISSQLFIVDLLRRRMYKAAGIKQRPKKPPHESQTNFMPMATGLGFTRNAPTREVNGATQFFKTIPSIFSRKKKEPRDKSRIIYVNNRHPLHIDEPSHSHPLAPDVRQAVMNEIMQPLQFQSRPGTGGVRKGMQISGKTMVLFLTFAYRKNTHGKGLARNYWGNRAKTRHYSEWWQPLYYPHVMDIIKYAEEMTNIQMVVVTENNWKRLTQLPKFSFAVLCYAHFPHLYQDISSLEEVKSRTGEIIGKGLRKMI